MMRLFGIIIACVWLVACVSTTGGPSSQPTRLGGQFAEIPIRGFNVEAARQPVMRSNFDIASEFLDLVFALENGKDLPIMTRFKGPITVAFSSDPSATAERDLRQLLERLRVEAGLNIRQVEHGADASIIINFVSLRQLQAIVPTAACFVVPNVSSYEELKKYRRTERTDWSALKVREKASVFIPTGISAQETRDCLNEELAQAIGPLNDLYRVAETVYNDDNFHTVLTSYDMLILRAIYDPVMRNGMSRIQAAIEIQDVIDRLNPAGIGYAPSKQIKTERDWIDQIEKALGPKTSQGARITAINKAIDQASADYRDIRLAFATYGRARLQARQNPKQAAIDYLIAYNTYATLLGRDDIHAATISLQLASAALSAGDTASAKAFINRAIPQARKAQNAALLFKLMILQTNILAREGNTAEAAKIKQEAIGYGKYGLASEKEILEVLSIVESFNS